MLAAAVLMMVWHGETRSTEVAGVGVEPTARVGGADLALNGAGLRRRFMTDIYVIGLYLERPVASAQAAIGAGGPKRIALTLMREIPAQSLVDALYEGIRDNTSEAGFARLKVSADALAAVMLPLNAAKKGDVLALDYLPDAGAQVVVNGRPIGHPVPGAELYQALLKIWLGEAPVDAELKRALLAGRY